MAAVLFSWAMVAGGTEKQHWLEHFKFLKYKSAIIKGFTQCQLHTHVTNLKKSI